MKIKLISNSSQLYLSDFLEKEKDVDLKFGLVQSNLIVTEKNSFSIKIAKQIDKFLGKFYKVPEIDKKIAEHILGATEYLKKQSLNIIKELNVNIILSSSTNQFKKEKRIDDYNLEGREEELHLAEILPSKQIMSLGVNAFNLDKTKSDATYDLLKKIETKDFVEFVFFHEYAHGMEFAFKEDNQMVFEDNLKTILLDKIYNAKSNYLTNQINTEIRKGFKDKYQSEYMQIDKEWSENLGVLNGEIYADVVGLLMKRNKMLSEGKDKKEFIEFAENIKNWRNYSQSKKLRDNIHLKEYTETKISHLTTPGIDLLLEKIDKFGEKELTELEINNLTKEIQLKSICRLIYTQIEINNTLVPCLKTLLEFNMISDGTFTVCEHGKYKDFMDMIKKECGDDWINNLHNKIKDMPEGMKKNKEMHIFDMGISPSIYSSSLGLNSFLEEAFEDSIIEDKLKVTDKISSLTNRFRQSEKNVTMRPK